MRRKSLDEQQKSPAYRTLMVLHAIGAHGPISLNRLCDRLTLPRSSIWRAAATLRDFGWVRMRLADNAYELTSRCDIALADSHFAHPACDLAEAALNEAIEAGAPAADAGMFVTPGRFVLIESTRRDAELGVPLSLIDDRFALAAQAAMPPGRLLRHLRAYQRLAGPLESEMIRSGAHARTIMDLTKDQKARRAVPPRMLGFNDEILFVTAQG